MVVVRVAVCALAFAFATVALPCASSAQESTPEEKARTLLEQAKSAREAKDVATALRLFRESYDANPSASLDTLVNLADCERELGQTTAAYLHYGEFLRGVKPTDMRAADVTSTMTAMMQAGPWIRVSGRNALSANVVVRIDGIALGPVATTAEEDVPAQPGEHVITLSKPPRGERKINTLVEVGKRALVDVGPKVPTKGSTGPVPVGPEVPKPFPHWVLPTGIMVSGVGGLTSLMIGAVYAGGATTARAALEKDCAKDDGNASTCDPAKVADLDFRQSQADRSATTSIALFAVGGVLTTTAVVLALVNRSRSTNVAFAPIPVPGGGALSIAGRF